MVRSRKNKPSKGRRRIELKRIEGEEALFISFSKRRTGACSKASDLSTLCGGDLALIVASPSGKLHSFGCPDVMSVVDRFLFGGAAPQPGSNPERDRLQLSIQNFNNQVTEHKSRLKAEKNRKAQLEDRLQITGEATLDFRLLDDVDDSSYEELALVNELIPVLRSLALARSKELAGGASSSNVPARLIDQRGGALSSRAIFFSANPRREGSSSSSFVAGGSGEGGGGGGGYYLPSNSSLAANQLMSYKEGLVMSNPVLNPATAENQMHYRWKPLQSNPVNQVSAANPILSSQRGLVQSKPSNPAIPSTQTQFSKYPFRTDPQQQLNSSNQISQYPVLASNQMQPRNLHPSDPLQPDPLTHVVATTQVISYQVQPNPSNMFVATSQIQMVMNRYQLDPLQLHPSNWVEVNNHVQNENLYQQVNPLQQNRSNQVVVADHVTTLNLFRPNESSQMNPFGSIDGPINHMRGMNPFENVELFESDRSKFVPSTVNSIQVNPFENLSFQLINPPNQQVMVANPMQELLAHPFEDGTTQTNWDILSANLNMANPFEPISAQENPSVGVSTELELFQPSPSNFTTMDGEHIIETTSMFDSGQFQPNTSNELMFAVNPPRAGMVIPGEPGPSVAYPPSVCMEFQDSDDDHQLF